MTKRQMLESAGVRVLRALVYELELEADKRSRASMTDALCRARRVSLALVAERCGLADSPGSAPTQRPRRPRASGGGTFVAIDFETADHGRDSACAVGLARVERGRVVRCESHLIRPPRRQFAFTHVHGITWPMVARQPNFAELWPTLAGRLEGASFLAAHNAPFDRSVLLACCALAGLEPPALTFVC